jgi:hypothetical protein
MVCVAPVTYEHFNMQYQLSHGRAFHRDTFTKYLDLILQSVEELADDIFVQNANKLLQQHEHKLVIAIDCGWLNRGFNSSSGTTVRVDVKTGKIIHQLSRTKGVNYGSHCSSGAMEIDMIIGSDNEMTKEDEEDKKKKKKKNNHQRSFLYKNCERSKIMKRNNRPYLVS